MEVLIPSVMALRETAMTAPLGQQGEPFAPLRKGSLCPHPPAAAGTFPQGKAGDADCHTSLRYIMV